MVLVQNIYIYIFFLSLHYWDDMKVWLKDCSSLSWCDADWLGASWHYSCSSVVCVVAHRRNFPFFKTQFKLKYFWTTVEADAYVCTHVIVNKWKWCPGPELRLQLPDGSLICRSHSGQLQQSKVTRAKLITPPSSKNASMETETDDFNVFTSSENRATWSSASNDRGVA